MQKFHTNKTVLHTLMLLGMFSMTGTATAQYTVIVPKSAGNDSVKCMQRIGYTPQLASKEKSTTKFLRINKDVTTFIALGETVKMMDISLGPDKVVGNQPGDNMVRIKPVTEMTDGMDAGVVTVVGERSVFQFSLIYVADPMQADVRYNCTDADGVSYLNPDVSMSRSQMYNYAWKILDRAKGSSYHDVNASANRLKLRLNNLYTSGEYFFLDISLLNKSRIQFDFEEVRFKLCDKRKMKATNSQEIEILPILSVYPAKRFKRHWRNVYVLPKFTFPDEKVLTVTISEKQISGRIITMTIDYTDVLAADSFDPTY